MIFVWIAASHASRAGPERTALAWAMAIAWDPGLADDELWSRLHEHFTEPQLIELGHFIALTLGQLAYQEATAGRGRARLQRVVASGGNTFRPA